jgi:hypothetical protein
MNRDRCDRVIQFALLEAGRQDDYTERDLGPIHLLKYVYLADLAYAEKMHGETFTGVPWRFHHYGPWAAEVYERIEPALDAIHAHRQVISSTRYDDDFVRWRLTDDELQAEIERELPFPVTSAIRRCVRQYGKDTGELLNYVYATKPMRRAAPGRELVLYVAEPTESSAPAPESPAPLSTREEKKRRERAGKAKVDIKAKLVARRALREQRTPVADAPRYDDVFERGLTWLDEVAGSPEQDVEGEAVFDDDVWESDARGDDRD